MDKFIELLNKIPPYIIVIYIAIFLTLEHFWPHSKDRKNRIGHLINNSGLLIIATVINFFISFILIGWVQYVDKNNIGLMNLLNLSATIKAFLGVIVLDFTSYFIHRFIHKSKFLWRFHRVHHSEIDMDSSTSFKFHPLEAVIVFPALLAEIGLVGISFPAIVLYNVIILPVFFILHSNLKRIQSGWKHFLVPYLRLRPFIVYIILMSRNTLILIMVIYFLFGIGGLEHFKKQTLKT